MMPPAPTGLTATPGDGQVTLSWTAPVYLDITGYAFISTAGNNYTPTPVPDSTPQRQATQVTGLTNGTEYTSVCAP